MTNHPNTITMDGEVKAVSIYDMKGYFKWVVDSGVVLVDPRYLGELFLLHTLRSDLLCQK